LYSFGDFIIGRLFFSLPFVKKEEKKQEQNFRWDHRCIKINTDSIIFASSSVYILLFDGKHDIICVGGCVLHCRQLQLQLQLQPNDWRWGVCVFLCRFLSSGVTRDLYEARAKGESGGRSGSLTTSIKATW